MDFELLSEITQIEPIARGAGVRIHRQERAELHWFEGHGIGRVELRYKKEAK
jgi:hypothetical protein